MATHDFFPETSLSEFRDFVVGYISSYTSSPNTFSSDTSSSGIYLSSIISISSWAELGLKKDLFEFVANSVLKHLLDPNQTDSSGMVRENLALFTKLLGSQLANSASECGLLTLIANHCTRNNVKRLITYIVVALFKSSNSYLNEEISCKLARNINFFIAPNPFYRAEESGGERLLLHFFRGINGIFPEKGEVDKLCVMEIFSKKNSKSLRVWQEAVCGFSNEFFTSN